MVDQVRENILSLKDVTDVEVEITFEPIWDRTIMSEEARYELGL